MKYRPWIEFSGIKEKTLIDLWLSCLNYSCIFFIQTEHCTQSCFIIQEAESPQRVLQSQVGKYLCFPACSHFLLSRVWLFIFWVPGFQQGTILDDFSGVLAWMFPLGVLVWMFPLGDASMDVFSWGTSMDASFVGDWDWCLCHQEKLPPQNSRVVIIWSLKPLASNSVCMPYPQSQNEDQKIISKGTEVVFPSPLS